MAMRLKISAGGSGGFAEGAKSQIDALSSQAEQTIGRAHTAAMAAVVKKDTAILREDIASGGFTNGLKLSRTWQGKSYPRSKPSMEPAGYILNKAGVIIDAFTDGVTIIVNGQHLLAIPQGPAKAIVRRLNQASNRSRDEGGRFLDESGTVQRVAAELGIPKLVMRLNQSSGKGVLIAPGRTLTKTGRSARGKAASGPDTVLFALVRQATLKQRIQGRRLLPKLGDTFEADFEAALLAELTPDER